MLENAFILSIKTTCIRIHGHGRVFILKPDAIFKMASCFPSGEIGRGVL